MVSCKQLLYNGGALAVNDDDDEDRYSDSLLDSEAEDSLVNFEMEPGEERAMWENNFLDGREDDDSESSGSNEAQEEEAGVRIGRFSTHAFFADERERLEGLTVLSQARFVSSGHGQINFSPEQGRIEDLTELRNARLQVASRHQDVGSMASSSSAAPDRAP